jgi:hypothetical protein
MLLATLTCPSIRRSRPVVSPQYFLGDTHLLQFEGSGMMSAEHLSLGQRRVSAKSNV